MHLILVDDPNNYEARAEVMWAGSLSHNGLTGCGNGGDDFATHRIEHEISGMFDVAHGAGLAAIWGSWARYVLDDCLLGLSSLRQMYGMLRILVMTVKSHSKAYREPRTSLKVSECLYL